MNKRSLVFLGSTQFGLLCLEKIFSSGLFNIRGILTLPEKFEISYNKAGVRNVQYADLSTFAREKNIPCKVMESTMKSPETLGILKHWEPDLFFVSGWYHLLPKEVLGIAPAYGIHFSLLPRFSGGAPLVWAVIEGEEKSGATLFQMEEGVDSGPILAQKSFEIERNDSIAEVLQKAQSAGIEILENQLHALSKNNLTLIPQNENDRTVYPQRSPADGIISWTQNALQLHNFIRAQSMPYPGAFSFLNGEKVIFWRAEYSSNIPPKNLQPGTLTPEGIVCGIEGSELLNPLEMSVTGNLLTSADTQTWLHNHQGKVLSCGI